MQDTVYSLAALLGPAAPLLTPPSPAQDAKGVQQTPAVLLLLDPQLTDLPFDWLPQLKAANAVVRDFSLHVHYTRMTVAVSSPQVMQAAWHGVNSQLRGVCVCVCGGMGERVGGHTFV